MPAYLVQLPSNKRVFDVDTLVVFAADAAGARSAAAGRFDGDSAALWNTVATVTEIVVGTALSDAGHDDWTAYCRVTGAAGQTAGFDPFVVEVDAKNSDPARGIKTVDTLHIGGGAVNAGGATYAINDILTVAGGTFTRAATFRVITVSTGAITSVELVDPGVYSVLPSLTANAVTGGSGSGGTLDLTQALEGSFEMLMARMVSALLTSPDIAGAALDLSEGAAGARLLTVASAGDSIGDATVTFEVRQNGTPFAPLVGTITDGGAAGAALSVAVPASPLAPPRIVALKS